MAVERGLPAVPRGLSREMTTYLQSLHNVILSMSGLGRGTNQTRSVRASEVKGIVAEYGNSILKKGSIDEDKIADGAVTENKLANGSVTAKKLAPSSVDARALADGAVGSNELAAHAVTLDKIAPELLPEISNGIADHGSVVNLGIYIERPIVTICGLEIPVGDCGEIRSAIENIRMENGEWLFDAVAVCEFGEEDGMACYPGKLHWLAIGRRANNADE